jgi:hypothetical protein
MTRRRHASVPWTGWWRPERPKDCSPGVMAAQSKKATGTSLVKRERKSIFQGVDMVVL